MSTHNSEGELPKVGQLIKLQSGRYGRLVRQISEQWVQVDRISATVSEVNMSYKASTPVIIKEKHVTIVCSNCEQTQNASIALYEGSPYWAYAHQCTNCEYLIMESEWNEVNE